MRIHGLEGGASTRHGRVSALTAHHDAGGACVLVSGVVREAGRSGASNVQVGGKHIPAMIDATDANAGWDSIQVLMEGCMRSPPNACPTTAEFWKSNLQTDAIIARMLEIVKLVMIMLLALTGSKENERSFSDMNFLKDDKRNSLEEDHLNVCMRGWRCRFSVADFPYDAALGAWHRNPRRMVNM